MKLSSSTGTFVSFHCSKQHGAAVEAIDQDFPLSLVGWAPCGGDIKMSRSDQKQGGFVVEANRLETPSMLGFRRGMNCTKVIGHKLNTMYDVPGDTPSRIASLIGRLERKLR